MYVIAEPKFLNTALDRIEAVQTRMLDRFLTELDDLIDMVFISDDMGTQESQLISTTAWSEHFQARLTRWCDLIHAYGKKVLFHTDGVARDFVPHLIECGVDILNPIQHVCPGMERRVPNAILEKKSSSTAESKTSMSCHMELQRTCARK